MDTTGMTANEWQVLDALRQYGDWITPDSVMSRDLNAVGVYFTKRSLALTVGKLRRRELVMHRVNLGRTEYKAVPQREADPVALHEGERVSTMYDLPGTVPILTIGITTRGRLLYGTRAGKGWAFEPRWIGRVTGPAGALQDVLEHVQVDQHHIERQVYPSQLRQDLRTMLLNRGQAALAEIEPVFRAIARRDLISELARMRDDGEIRFEGARYRLVTVSN